jgi:hypothetical protein
MPGPSYALADGSEWFPSDYFALMDEAGGVDGLQPLFMERYVKAVLTSRAEPFAEAPDEEWEGYLSGGYGVCLRRVSPETIVQKTVLIGRIRELLSAPDTSSNTWKVLLRLAVDSLDDLERPFASWDRARFGGPVSRDLYVDAPRRDYPDVFADDLNDLQPPLTLEERLRRDLRRGRTRPTGPRSS